MILTVFRQPCRVVTMGELRLMPFTLFFFLAMSALHAQPGVYSDEHPFPCLPEIIAGFAAPMVCDGLGAIGRRTEKAGQAEPMLRGAVLRDGGGDTLTNVAVEIFLLDQEGQMHRVYSGLTHSGRFAIPLPPDAAHLLILRKAGFESQACLLEAGEVLRSHAFSLRERTPAAQDKTEKDIPAAPLPTILTGADTVDYIDLPGLMAASTPLLAAMAARAWAPDAGSPEELVARGSGRSPASGEEEEVTDRTLGVFMVTTPTSFRPEATHRAPVILRFQPGDAVELLEKTNDWWWRIRYAGRTGFVKARLLRPKD